MVVRIRMKAKGRLLYGQPTSGPASRLKPVSYTHLTLPTSDLV